MLAGDILLEAEPPGKVNPFVPRNVASPAGVANLFQADS